MEMKYSKEFVTLAKNGSFLATAEDLFIAQSTLSKRIQCLERDLGQKLFYRNTRKVDLTPFGKEYLAYAQEIVRIEEKCSSELVQKWGNAPTQIHIGLHHGLRSYGIPALIQGYQQEHRNHNIDILFADTETLLDMLTAQTCDFAIIRDPTNTFKAGQMERFNMSPFYMDSLVLVVPANHPLASQTSVTSKQLQNETFLSLPENTAMYKNCTKYMQDKVLDPRRIRIISSSSAIFDAVSAGLGVAVFGKMAMNSTPSPGLKAIDILPTSYLCIYMVTSKKHTISYSVQQCMDFLVKG